MANYAKTQLQSLGGPLKLLALSRKLSISEITLLKMSPRQDIPLVSLPLKLLHDIKTIEVF